MYAVDDGCVSAFWQDLHRAMRDAGLSRLPAELSHPGDLDVHWTDPKLLLSQSCGFPFITQLHGRVRYVATPCFRAEGCDGPLYSSAIVVRRDDSARAVRDLAGRRAAFNGRTSQSGYNALRSTIAPYAEQGRFFAAVIETGSHRASLAAVRNGDADVAAIDAVTLALLQRSAPHEVEGLRTLAFTQPTPGLPLITSAATSDEDLGCLRRACAEACHPSRPAARSLLLDGIAVLDENDYLPLRAMQAHAVARGYPELA